MAGTWGAAPLKPDGFSQAATGWRAPHSARNRGDRDWAALGSRDFPINLSQSDLLSSRSDGCKTNMTTKTTMTCGVPVRLGRLARQDGIPCAVTGRRAGHGGHGDDAVRIFIRLPGGSRFALWVSPELPVGPMVAPPSEMLFSQPVRATSPVRGLLAQQAEQAGSSFDFESSLGDMLSGQSEASALLTEHGSLKDLIEAATGIPAQSQKLVVGQRGKVEEPTRPLHLYDIGHGALLHLTVKSCDARKNVQFLASPKLTANYNTAGPWERIPKFMKSKASCGNRVAKELVEPLPDFHVSMAHEPKVLIQTASEVFYQDYTFLRDNHIFDLAGRIRKRFDKMPRVAHHANASNTIEDMKRRATVLPSLIKQEAHAADI